MLGRGGLVGRMMSLRTFHTLIPGAVDILRSHACDYVTLQGQRDFADVNVIMFIS